ncbi:uncharacterized protein LOC110720995 isoform X2 [Chenopodium quinoa]|uniref:uncharacterized protein LOC110720995 isoform X2 n=1 Tax=Chenopodium quinoa TaxID=63459 RepID=UPI000B778703|nr:uncharacterized protein LOC110720995 isoform X2 [Chenopodium quinoa]
MLMTRVSSPTFILIPILLALLTLSATAETRTCKKANEFCGGIAGFQCCEGLQCNLEGDFPDAGGKCKPTITTCNKCGQFCGGIAAFQCCEGLDCVLDGDYPDAGGVCRKPKQRSCHKAGQFCDGFTGVQCCKGFICLLDNVNNPDVGGKCKRVHH